MFNEYTYFNGVQEKVEDMVKHIDQWGSPTTYPHMAAGWSVALDSPFGWMKQVASDFGGTLLAWCFEARRSRPAPFQPDRCRPTILRRQVCRSPDSQRYGNRWKASLVFLLQTTAKERHITQYFEIAGNRAIYHDGWFARTIHRAPWEPKPRRALQDDVWELYDMRTDFSLASDLAAKNPKKLAEMKAVFMKEAEKYYVLPVDDRMFERLNAHAVGRPDLMAGRTSLTLAEGMTGMLENVFINVKNRSKTITAEVDVPQSGANGTVIAQGGRFGGWSLYVKDGVPAYDYNFLGLQRSSIAATKKLAPGKPR
jgi:arylsulfatase